MNRTARLLVVALLGVAGGRALSAPTASARQQPAADVQAGEAAARRQCVTCHGVPPRDILPRGYWRDAIARMFLMQVGQPEPVGPPGTAARMVRLPADWQAIAAYYEAGAPEQLARPESWPAPDQSLAMRRRVIPAPTSAPSAAVANVRLLDMDRDGRLEVYLSEMRHGIVYRVLPSGDPPTPVEIARLSNPAHLAPADLDGDGVLDLLVADLGRFAPADHDRGAVVWLRGRKDGTYVPVTLARGPRVSDVEAADFDSDGRLDLAVARFGWRRAGDFTIFRNETGDYARPSFAAQPIEARTGSIHATPVDLNGDTRLDVLAVFAQEHETVVAFLNLGGMRFDRQVVYAAPHPNWGSSGIEVVDLDRDGDPDVLMTNGDMLDDALLKPYHGIQWLENTGTFPFTVHRLATLAAVQRAQAVDLDGDHDLDVVACALAPEADRSGLPAVVWLEQTRPGAFERHVLAAGVPMHATLDAGDLDNDGDMDLVVGHFSFDAPVPGLATVFENLRVHK